MLLFLTIIKYSFSTKKVISKSWLEKRHYQHKRFCFFIEFHVALQSKDADSLSFQVAETKTLVIYLLSYEALKIRYKKRLTTTRVFCFTLFMLWLLTIIKYSFSTKNVISECLIDKTHQQHKKICFFYWIHVAVTK